MTSRPDASSPLPLAGKTICHEASLLNASQNGRPSPCPYIPSDSPKLQTTAFIEAEQASHEASHITNKLSLANVDAI